MITEDEAPAEEAVGGRRMKRDRPKRGLGSAITRKRRIQAEELQQQVAERIRKEKEAARQEIERFRNRKAVTPQQEVDNWASNMLRSVVNNQTAVLRSYGYSLPVTCNIGGGHVNAWTDFKRISVTWPMDMIPNRLDRAPVLDTIAQMKGVMQHEMGHVRFTTSFKTIKDTATIKGGHPVSLVFRCWNMLEDMRMETLVVEAVPRIKNYFGTMVANVCLMGGNLPLEQTWLMLAGREYLPKAVLRKSYELFDQFCFDMGVSDGAMTWHGLVQNYKAAKTEQQVMDAVVKAYEFIQSVRAAMPPTPDDMSQMENNANNADLKDTSRKPQGSILDMFDDKPRKPSKGQSEEEGQGEGEEGEEGEGQSYADDYNEEESNAPSPQGRGKNDLDPEDGTDDASGEGEGDKKGSKKQPQKNRPPSQSNHGDGSESKTEEDFEDALRKMAEQFQGDTRKDADVLAMARGAAAHQDHDGLPIYPHYGEEMSATLKGRALITSLGIQDALNSFVTEASPTWHSRMDTGIIDPLAYRTKNTGDRDFRRHLDDRGLQGLDVHVSMLCDVSGSMGGIPMQALSESLYATATACDNLGIGASYVLWSSDGQNYRVWTDGNVTPTLWPTMGGTDPTKALDDLDTHNPEEAANHLVIVFTDGAWSTGFPSLQRWAVPGRTFVLVRYGAYDGQMQRDMGADKHININDVNLLPGELTKALIDVLADGNGW